MYPLLNKELDSFQLYAPPPAPPVSNEVWRNISPRVSDKISCDVSSQLPNEIWFEITARLDVPAAMNFGMANKHLLGTLHADKFFWVRCLDQYFPDMKRADKRSFEEFQRCLESKRTQRIDRNITAGGTGHYMVQKFAVQGMTFQICIGEHYLYAMDYTGVLEWFDWKSQNKAGEIDLECRPPFVRGGCFPIEKEGLIFIPIRKGVNSYDLRVVDPKGKQLLLKIDCCLRFEVHNGCLYVQTKDRAGRSKSVVYEIGKKEASLRQIDSEEGLVGTVSRAASIMQADASSCVESGNFLFTLSELEKSIEFDISMKHLASGGVCSDQIYIYKASNRERVGALKRPGALADSEGYQGSVLAAGRGRVAIDSRSLTGECFIDVLDFDIEPLKIEEPGKGLLGNCSIQ